MKYQTSYMAPATEVPNYATFEYIHHASYWRIQGVALGAEAPHEIHDTYFS